MRALVVADRQVQVEERPDPVPGTGEVLVRELGRVTARTIELLALGRSDDDRLLSRDEVAWIARIVWVSQ